MWNVITNIPRVLKKFLDRFKDNLSSIQFNAFSQYIMGLLLYHKRVSIESIASLSSESSYENLQYFISESKCDMTTINDTRLKVLNHLHPTKSTNKGILIIDDTSSNKKCGSHTEGAKMQYSSLADGIINCNTVVVSAYADAIKRYPLDLRAYKPLEEFSSQNVGDFKNKLELAQELIDNAYNNESLSFSHVVFDSWYFSNDFVNELSSKNRLWITDCQVDRKISYQGKSLRAEDLVKVLPVLKFRKVATLINSKKQKRIFYLAECIIKIKGVHGEIKAIIAKGSWDEDDTKNIRILVTNHLALNACEIFSKYALRWGVECLFRDLKDNLGFAQYQTRSLKSITRHWYLTFVAHSFLLYAKFNSIFSKIVQVSLNTIADLLSAFRRINTYYCIQRLTKNKLNIDNLLGLFHLESS
jgi:SRSO17 transposase